MEERVVDSAICSSSSFELFVVSIMQEDVLYIHCVSAHVRFANLQLDWGHHDE